MYYNYKSTFRLCVFQDRVKVNCHCSFGCFLRNWPLPCTILRAAARFHSRVMNCDRLFFRYLVSTTVAAPTLLLYCDLLPHRMPPMPPPLSLSLSQKPHSIALKCSLPSPLPPTLLQQSFFVVMLLGVTRATSLVRRTTMCLSYSTCVHIKPNCDCCCNTGGGEETRQ